MGPHSQCSESSPILSGCQYNRDMSRRPKTIAITTLLLTALVVSACGGDSDGSATGEGRQIDVCSLITVAEAEVWLGGPVEPPAPYDGPNPEPTCVYKSTGAQSQILLQVRDGAKYYGGDNAEVHPDATPVAIGEKGFAESGSVGFLQNDWTVMVSRTSGPVTEESLMAAAQTVSGRLP